MTRNTYFPYVGLIALVALLIFSLTAWNQTATPSHRTQVDTTPRKADKKIKDIDEAMAELDKAMDKLDKEIKKPLHIPAFNADKIKADIDKSLKDLDPEKMKADLEKSLKDIDAEKMSADIQKSLKDIDVAKIKADMEASIAKIDMEKLKADLEKMKTIDIPKLEAELKNLGPQIEESLKSAKENMEKAKKEMQEYKGFIDGLEKDGLINRKGNYTIEHKEGTLIINDKLQPADVYNKYKSFLQKQKDFKITKDADSFNIHND